MNPESNPSPYLSGNYAPVHTEISAAGLVVEGEIPRDLQGTFVRTGSNPRYLPQGRYHWFDGDGMVHAVRFEDGSASYRNRWVRTSAFLAESEAGRALWTGVTERPDFTNPRGPFKDSANTDLVYFPPGPAGQLLCLWWLGGQPYVMGLPDLDTRGVQDFGGRMPTVSAHPKIDAVTGEMMVFDYKPVPPYLTYAVIDRTGQVTHKTTLDLPGPRLQHDVAITERHTLFMDMSMMWDPELLRQGKTRVRFFRDKPTRFGLLPRHAPGAEVRWFDASPCYIYHTINAWEDGDHVVLIGCKIDAPLADDPYNPTVMQEVPTIGFLRLQPRLHRWRFDLATGAVHEEYLDDVLTEFPRMDNRRLGRRSRYSYNPRIHSGPTLLFDGVIKYNTESGAAFAHEYPQGCFGGEVVFAPRQGAQPRNPDDEDDGYLITFVVNERSGESEVHVLDARDVERPPLARVLIPQRVPTGYHAFWVPQEPL